jgi:ADP-L-glycero-D-manno-heptose 6-epimerase
MLREFYHGRDGTYLNPVIIRCCSELWKDATVITLENFMYIVTGAAGLIGSAMIAKLNAEGIDDIIAVDRLGNSESWKNFRTLAFTEYYEKEQLLELISTKRKLLPKKITAIIHLGASSSTTVTDASYLMENNYKYTQTLANFCLKENIRFIYASSAATYGNGENGYSDDHDVIPTLMPLNAYGYSKQIFDLWVLRNKLEKKFVGVKFFNVFGPNGYHKGSMLPAGERPYRQLMSEGKIKLFKSYNPEYKDGESKRDFVYVKDCVNVLWWFLNNKKVNGIYNLGSGKAVSWNELASVICKAAGKPFSVEYIDMPAELRSQYQYFTEAPMDKLREAGCKVKFLTFEESMTEFVQEYLMAGDKHLSGDNW